MDPARGVKPAEGAESLQENATLRTRRLGIRLALLPRMEKSKRIHLRVAEGEYHLIRELADERGETVATFMRRLVRVYRLMRPDASLPQPEVKVEAVETGPRVFG